MGEYHYDGMKSTVAITSIQDAKRRWTSVGTKTKASLGGHEVQVGGKAIDPLLEIDSVAFPTTVWGSQAKDWPEVWTLAKDREAQPYSGGRIALIGIPLKSIRCCAQRYVFARCDKFGRHAQLVGVSQRSSVSWMSLLAWQMVVMDGGYLGGARTCEVDLGRKRWPRGGIHVVVRHTGIDLRIAQH